MDPVAQARANLDSWNARRRHPGESSHWRHFNSRISSLHDLSRFREVNSRSGNERLGLDDSRTSTSHEAIRDVFRALVTRFGLPSVEPLLEASIGSPPTVEHRLGTGRTSLIDYHDLFLVNYALTLAQCIAKQGVAGDLVVEIGGGYGGTVAKLAKLLPHAQFVMIDLPPACLLQAYYLSTAFPDSVHVCDLHDTNPRMQLVRRFTICPSPTMHVWYHPVDVFLNTRSFQEMTRRDIRHYFRTIQRSTRVGGLFMNVNRYVRRGSFHEGMLMADFPYDTKWRTLLSQPSFFQEEKIWEHVALRTSTEEPNSHSWRDQLPAAAHRTSRGFVMCSAIRRARQKYWR